MKKLIYLGCLTLIAACQSAASTSTAEVTPIKSVQTPTVPATATTALTPTQILTPTPFPLFFTEEFNAGIGAWISFQTGGETSPTLSLKDGLLRMDIASPNTWYYAIHNAHDYQDILVSAKFTATPPGSIGLICRYSEHGWYEFNISSDGTYNVLIAQWLGDGIAKYTPIANDESEYLHAGTLDYEIGLTCQKDSLLLHVNGKLFRKLNVSRYGLAEGKIGLAAASFEEVPMIASFDRVEVAEPDQ